MKEPIERPLISIICITYNHENYIRDALDSFLMQDCKYPYEIVIHDDCSTDKTAQLIKEYEKKYPTLIRAMYQSVNQYSQGVAINDTFSYPRAQGKYIAYCEGDDYWIDPKKLEKQAEYMEAHPECSLCFHSVKDVRPDKSLIDIYQPFENSQIVSMMDLALSFRTYTFASFMYRTDYILNPPDFYTKCPVGDVPLLWLMSSKGNVYFFKEVMGCYRKGVSGSWDQKLWSGDFLPKLEEHMAAMKHMLKEFNRYSDGKYEEQVKIAEDGRDFELAMAKQDFKQVCDKKYRIFFRQLPQKARIGALIGCYLPWLFRLLKGSKG